MSEFMKTLMNIRSLRAILRELPFEQLAEAKDKFDTIYAERESDEARFSAENAKHQRKLAEFSEMLRDAGIDPSELVGTTGVVKADRQTQVKAQRAPRPPKYTYLDDGIERTWTGQGRMPRIIADGVAGGKTLDDYQI